MALKRIVFPIVWQKGKVHSNAVGANLSEVRSMLVGIAWAGLAVVIWSGSFVMLRLGVQGNLTAFDLTAIRFAVSAAILAPVIIRKGFIAANLGVLQAFLMTVCFGAPYVLLMSLAFQFVPASSGGTIIPGTMALVSIFFAGTLQDGSTRCGAILIIVGVAITISVFGSASVGNTILIATGCMWAGYSHILRRSKIPAMHATAIVAVGSAFIYLPVYLMILPKGLGGTSLADLLAQAAFQGILVSVIAVFAFGRSVELLGRTTAIALPALIPFGTVVLGGMILDEALGTKEILSSLAIAAGVFFILRSERPYPRG